MVNAFDLEIPDHTLLSRLGRGGMAAVYLAREDRLGREVAVKVIDPDHDTDAEFRERFEREAKTAASLTHSNIVPVFRYGFTPDDRPYITMALMKGGSLRDRLKKRGTVPVVEALEITKQIASALRVAHQRNHIHRDLKPENILFNEGTAMLSDFGIAKALDGNAHLTRTGMNPGTPQYYSPEQAREQLPDQRSDLYALGVVLYEMLTGRLPIEAPTPMSLMMAIANRPADKLPDALKGLQPLMDAMLTKDPADRLGACSDLITTIGLMEDNWVRYRDVNRLIEGVAITPPRKATAKADVGVATNPSQEAPVSPPVIEHNEPSVRPTLSADESKAPPAEADEPGEASTFRFGWLISAVAPLVVLGLGMLMQPKSTGERVTEAIALPEPAPNAATPSLSDESDGSLAGDMQPAPASAPPMASEDASATFASQSSASLFDVDADTEWARGQPAASYTVQLLGVSALAPVRLYAAAHRDIKLRVVRTQRGEQVWYLVISGSFASRAAAQSSLTNLPVGEGSTPWIRTFEGIQGDIESPPDIF